MIDFLSRFDASGRTPRGVQADALTWLANVWDRHSIFALSAPVAVGKSAIAKAISLATGGHIITPTNLLIDQYTDTYAETNYLKGKNHYSCSPQMSCYEWVNECEQKACAGCPYTAAKARAEEEATFFNPMSYWYWTFSEKYTPPEVLIVDEAHTLISSLMMICGVRLRFSEYRFPKNCNDELVLVKWLDKTIEGLVKLRELSKADRKKYAEISRSIMTMRLTAQGLKNEPELYAIWTEAGKFRGHKDTFLNIKPIKVPKYITDRMLQSTKLILMSGTLLETGVRDLIGNRPYAFKELPSPIDISRRRVLYKPTPFKMNWETKPSMIAGAVKSTLDQHSQQNAIVHVSYSMSAKLQDHLPDSYLFNTSETKDEILKRFKLYGGVFIAAGCAEGIDLKGDLARVNIIPKLLFPDLNDPVVKKRRSLADGEEWYAMQTIQTLIQQTGRTTRDVSDHSVIYILDPSFARLYARWKHKIPQYFKEAVVWV